MTIRKLFILATALAALAPGLPTGATAAILDFDFSGTVLQNELGALFPGKAVGDSYSGRFTLDTAAPAIQVAGFASLDPTNFAISIEGISYSVFQVSVWYDTAPTPDGFEINFRVPVAGFEVDGFLSFRSSLDILSGPTLPDSLDLSLFDHVARVALTFEDFFKNINLHDEGNVTAVAPVPEPATLALLGLGFAGIRLLRRRRKV